MNHLYERVMGDMETFMLKHTQKETYSLEETEKIIMYLVQYYHQLKLERNESTFKTVQDEINYFKNVKPLLISKLIHFSKLYKIESEKPYHISYTTNPKIHR